VQAGSGERQFIEPSWYFCFSEFVTIFFFFRKSPDLSPLVARPVASKDLSPASPSTKGKKH
jgi:hypothetical protein